MASSGSGLPWSEARLNQGPKNRGKGRANQASKARGQLQRPHITKTLWRGLLRDPKQKVNSVPGDLAHIQIGVIQAKEGLTKQMSNEIGPRMIDLVWFIVEARRRARGSKNDPQQVMQPCGRGRRELGSSALKIGIHDESCSLRKFRTD
ncbi:MAG: hypothetical protein ACKPKO_30035, partial [Candidatus Fonsibacter sp.]